MNCLKRTAVEISSRVSEEEVGYLAAEEGRGGPKMQRGLRASLEGRQTEFFISRVEDTIALGLSCCLCRFSVSCPCAGEGHDFQGEVGSTA